MIESFRIDYRAIDKSFGKNRVLENIALTLKNHECIVITGENGAGKTTLLRILAGLEKPGRGDVSFDHARAESWRRQRKRLLQYLMYLHQQPYMLAGSLRRNLEYTARLNPAIVDRATAVDRATDWAELRHLELQSAASLSGGQKQRVALARARLRDPRVLLLDEPTANLDRNSRERTLQMLREFRDDGTAIVIVTHDPGNFASLATENLQLHDRRLQPDGGRPGGVIDIGSRRQVQKR